MGYGGGEGLEAPELAREGARRAGERGWVVRVRGGEGREGSGAEVGPRGESGAGRWVVASGGAGREEGRWGRRKVAEITLARPIGKGRSVLTGIHRRSSSDSGGVLRNMGSLVAERVSCVRGKERGGEVVM